MNIHQNNPENVCTNGAHEQRALRQPCAHCGSADSNYKLKKKAAKK
jgi:hypothetical protein